MPGAGTNISVSATDDGATAAFQAVAREEKNVAEGAAKIATQYKAATREQAELARAAKRFFNETRTPLEKHNATLRQLDNLLKQNKIDQETYNRAVQQSTAAYRSAEAAARRTATANEGAFGRHALGLVHTFVGAAGIGSVAGVVYTIIGSYDKWIQKQREVAAEAGKAARELVTLATIQEKGTRAPRVQQAAALAARYGITDRAEAFDTVQSLQSIHGGDFKKGMAAAEAVFAASLVGVELERGKELEILGAGMQQAPGSMIKRAYVAGQATGREPSTIAGAAAGFKFWKDKDFGAAVAGVLSETMPETQLPVYLKQAGSALSGTGKVAEYLSAEQTNAFLKSKGLREGAEKAERKAFIEGGIISQFDAATGKNRKVTHRGLPEADRKRLAEIQEASGGFGTQEARLRELSRRGIDTEEELVKIGVDERRQREALLGLIPRTADVLRIRDVVARRAKGELFAEERGAIEAEMPITALERVTGSQKAESADITAFGPGSIGAKIQEIKERARGTTYKRLGVRQFLGYDTYDAEGRATEKDAWFAGLSVPYNRELKAKARKEGGTQRIPGLTDASPVFPDEYLRLSVAAEQYKQLSRAHYASTRRPEAQTPEAQEQTREIAEVLRDLKNTLERWSEWKNVEKQAEAAVKLDAAAGKLEAAADRMQPPRANPARNHRDRR